MANTQFETVLQQNKNDINLYILDNKLVRILWIADAENQKFLRKSSSAASRTTT